MFIIGFIFLTFTILRIFGDEENYKPWKKLIGTPKDKLKLIELDNVGHGLPWDTIIKHHSNWIKAHTIN